MWRLVAAFFFFQFKCVTSAKPIRLMVLEAFLVYCKMSVLLKNTPLLKFMPNHIRDPSGVFFHILTSKCIDDVISRLFSVACTNSRRKMAFDRFVYMTKRKLHGGLKIWILFSRVKKQYYNIARVHPNWIPIGVIMVHFSAYTWPCVHLMTCASRMGEACARYVIKTFYRETTPLKMYIYKSLSKFNETLRLNRYEKTLSPFFFTENFVIYQEQNLFSRNHRCFYHSKIKFISSRRRVICSI